jgi:hypothetical protein
MRTTLSLALLLTSLVVTSATAQVPQPFPKPGAPGSTPPVAAPSAPPQTGAPVAPKSAPEPPAGSLGVPIYPSAQFITSYDAGMGQRYYLYGTNATFAEIVQYYRNTLKQRGELVYEQPAVHQFDIGRFREETMAFPPSVTVKDYTFGGTGGYLNPKRGGSPARFPTIIQIVPPVPGADR